MRGAEHLRVEHKVSCNNGGVVENIRAVQVGLQLL